MARPVAARQPQRQDVEEAPDRDQAECRRIPLQFMWLWTIGQRGHHGKTPVVAGFTQVLRKEEKQRAKKQYRTMFMPGQFKLSSSSSSVAAASLCPHLCPHLQLALFFTFLLLEFLVPRHGERQRQRRRHQH